MFIAKEVWSKIDKYSMVKVVVQKGDLQLYFYLKCYSGWTKSDQTVGMFGGFEQCNQYLPYTLW